MPLMLIRADNARQIASKQIKLSASAEEQLAELEKLIFEAASKGQRRIDFSPYRAVDQGVKQTLSLAGYELSGGENTTVILYSVHW